MANNELQAVLERRTNSWKRAIAKVERVTAESEKYEAENDGFLSPILVHRLDRAQTAQSKSYLAMVAVEKKLNIHATPAK